MRPLEVCRIAVLAFGVSVVAVTGLGTPGPALADDTGLAQSLHDVRREGRRLCLVDHFHDGYSAGQVSKKVAEREAIAAWAGFTAFEYGSSWGSWSKAKSRSMKCAREGAGWACQATARPCR